MWSSLLRISLAALFLASEVPGHAPKMIDGGELGGGVEGGDVEGGGDSGLHFAVSIFSPIPGSIVPGGVVEITWSVAPGCPAGSMALLLLDKEPMDPLTRWPCTAADNRQVFDVEFGPDDDKHEIEIILIRPDGSPDRHDDTTQRLAWARTWFKVDPSRAPTRGRLVGLNPGVRDDDGQLREGGFERYIPKSSTKHIEDLATYMWTGLWGNEPLMDQNGRFLFVSFGNKAFVPFFLSWLCNTAHMAEVHERTLLVFTDVEGYEEMLRHRWKHPQVQVVLATLDDSLSEEQKFRSVGYCLIMEHRNKIIGKLLDGGVSVLLFEADAVWRSNPLNDPQLTETESELIVFLNAVRKTPEYGKYLDADSIGMGFTLLRATDRVLGLWQELMAAHRKELAYLDEALYGEGGIGMNKSELAAVFASDVISGYKDEMVLFQGLVSEAQHRKTVNVSVLPWCQYPSGLWYDAGLGGDGFALRLACRDGGQEPIVVQNNFIYGLEAKRSRAERWGHWFVHGDSELECLDEEGLRMDLAAMEESFQSLRPHKRPAPDECPRCTESPEV